jgi:hypothetical protein
LGPSLPWLAMGYMFNKHASFSSFSPYFLLFSQKLDFSTSICNEPRQSSISMIQPCGHVHVIKKKDFQEIHASMIFKNLAFIPHNDH